MYTYEWLTKDIENLKNENNNINISAICRTALERDVKLIKIGHGDKRILYVGAHHGMEYITSALLMEFASALSALIQHGENLFQRPIDTASGKRLERCCSFYIIPMLNPDGVTISCEGVEKALQYCDEHKKEEYSGLLKSAAHRAMKNGKENSPNDSIFTHTAYRSEKDVYRRWQANGRGVDLNHNYSSGFSEYKSMELREGRIYPAPTRYSGPYPESEAESAALGSLIRGTGFSLMLTFHSQGGELYGSDFYDLGNIKDYYTCSGCDPLKSLKENGAGSDILRRISDGYRRRCCERSVGRYIEKTSGYLRSIPEGAAAYGGLTDWYTDFYRKPAFTVEVGHGRNPLPMSALNDIKKDLLFMMLTAPMIL